MNTATQIAQLLNSTNGVTFARVAYTVEVKTAAANKHRKVEKHVEANVQLFANIKQATEVFALAVKRTGAKLANDAAKLDAFKSQQNYFEHTDTYSVVKHRKNERLYLYCFYNTVHSTEYTIDGAPATKAEVAELLTPSAREALLNPPATTHNKTYDVHHAVTVRTIGMDSLRSLKTNGQTLTF